MSWLYLERLDCSWTFSYLPWWLYLCEVKQWVAVLRCCILGREAIWKRGMTGNVSKLSLRSPFFTDHFIKGAIIKPNNLISPGVSSFIITWVAQCSQLRSFVGEIKKEECWFEMSVWGFFLSFIWYNWSTYLIVDKLSSVFILIIPTKFPWGSKNNNAEPHIKCSYLLSLYSSQKFCWTICPRKDFW